MARYSHRRNKALSFLFAGILLASLFGAEDTLGERNGSAAQLFSTSDQCQSCHNNLGAEGGVDLSIGTSFQGTMMANAAVDPYWLAGVRREITDHPNARAAIEDECAKCHKPMQRFVNVESGVLGRVFECVGEACAETETAFGELSLDGVSCTVCHQVGPDNLGKKESFVGGFEIDTRAPTDEREIYGPYVVADATKRVMRSATGFQPESSEHIQSAEFCATCHTLYTHSLDKDGNVIGEFPEQVPFLEWLHSDFGKAGETAETCQSCHMATPSNATPISSVLGKPREDFSVHSFRGGNFLMLGILSENSHELGARAAPASLEVSGRRTKENLERASANVSIAPYEDAGDGQLRFDVSVENLAGHKLPTAYPSRRVWIEVNVRDQNKKSIFHSGALEPDGSIEGNDNDRDARRFEPHYRSISKPSEVQIFEAILGKPGGGVTTGLLEATQYLKDNRLLPLGFDKATALQDIAVHGAAAKDEDFGAGSDTTRYTIDAAPSQGSFEVEVKLWYQPIGYRWARNLGEYDAEEPRRFVRMYESVRGADTAVMLAQVVNVVERDPVQTETVGTTE